MIFEILMNSLKKIKKNVGYIILATLGIVFSSFIIMTIFIFSNAAKKVLVLYLCDKFPAVNIITCEINCDEKYYMTIDELSALCNSKKSNIEKISFISQDIIDFSMFGDNGFQMYGAYNDPPSIELICGSLDAEIKNNRWHSMIIHESIAKKYFKNIEDSINHTVIIQTQNGNTYEMIISGVYKNINSQISTQTNVYCPFLQAQKMLGKNEPYTTSKFWVRMTDLKDAHQTKTYISSVLDKRFSMQDDYKYKILLAEVIDTVNSTINLVSALLILFSTIIFIVSGISIKNVLISIMQTYIHQIGIEKAIGASESVICMEYLLQGVIISFIGTITSFIITMCLLKAVNLNIKQILLSCSGLLHMSFLKNADITFSLTAADILISFVFSVVIVILCCYSPIRKASEMKIVDALRK